jgi:hypothetical protein
VNGELWNIEFATVENVKDPVKAAEIGCGGTGAVRALASMSSRHGRSTFGTKRA